MPLTIGTQLGSHQITGLLGRGGMGEVYRGRDNKLKRDVAIKILPEEFSRDPERVVRFQREAEVLASLNHPNIAAIYDVEEAGGTRFLVLELVEGETLAERIQRGPIRIEEALEIGKQICEALEAAHEKGIVHRDLKPANVKIAPDGRVKVLDFGLAKAMENAPEATTLSNSPTMTIGATQAGVILGTAAYMSPEQAKGFQAERQSDVFAFGSVLFEMLTGRQAFHGDTVAEILASVLVREPDLALVPENLNPRIRELLQRCFQKNPKRRWQAVGDLRAELETIAAAPRVGATSTTAGSLQPPLWKRLVPAVVSAIVFSMIGGMVVWRLKPVVPPARVVRFFFTVPDPNLKGIMRLSDKGDEPEVLVKATGDEIDSSPQLLNHGRAVLFTVTPSRAGGNSDQSQIVVQPLPSGDRKVVVRGFDAHYLPSGHLIYSVGGDVMSVAFDLNELKMKGLPVPVIEGVRRSGSFSQLSVSDRGGLIFIPGEAGGAGNRTVVALADRDGKLQKLPLPPAAYENPRISPNGKSLAVGVSDGSERFVSIYPLSGNKSPVRLTFGGQDTIPVWSPDSRYVYFRSVRDGKLGLFRQLVAGSSEAERLTEAETIDDRHNPISIDPFNQVLTFEFRQGPGDSDIWILPLEGDRKPRPLVVRPNFQSHSVFSPRGKWLAYMSNELSTYRPQIFVEPYPITRAKHQVTMENGGEPLWSPDGKQLFYFWQSKLYAIDIQTEPEFSLGAATPLPITGAQQATGGPRNYDINLANPNQFVVILAASQSEKSEAPPSQINIVLNWLEELKQRVPVK